MLTLEVSSPNDSHIQRSHILIGYPLFTQNCSKLIGVMLEINWEDNFALLGIKEDRYFCTSCGNCHTRFVSRILAQGKSKTTPQPFVYEDQLRTVHLINLDGKMTVIFNGQLGIR